VKKKYIAFSTVFMAIGLSATLLLNSCAGFKLVSQRSSVDANSGASATEAPATGDAAWTDAKTDKPNADAVSAATGE